MTTAWPPALRDGIARLAAAYVRLFRREAEKRLYADFPDLGRKEFDRIVQEAADRSWATFEEEELPGVIEELGGSSLQLVKMTSKR